MEKIENYIYIAIILISVIISVFQKKNKKENEESAPTTMPKMPKYLKEIFSEPIPQPQTKSVTTKVHKEIKPSLQKNQTLSQAREQNSAMRDNLAAKRNIFKHTDTSDETSSRHFDVKLDNANDWQKAFVYSEIFDKKY